MDWEKLNLYESQANYLAILILIVLLLVNLAKGWRWLGFIPRPLKRK